MNKVAVVLACLACVGHGHQAQTSPRSKALAQLLLATNPEDAFKPSIPGSMSRRDLIAHAGAGLAALSAAQAANAKSGDFGTLNFFSATEQATLSDPYSPSGVTGGRNADQGAAYGVGAGEGKAVVAGYKKSADDTVKAMFAKSEKRVRETAPNVDTGVWYLVGNDFRLEAYKMRKTMLVLTNCANTKAAAKGFDKYWATVNQLNDALAAKSGDAIKAKYQAVLAALDEWKKEVAF